MRTYTQLNRPIVVVDYDPNWPALYEAESERISSALGEQVLQIEHIGSTAVPGLAAKPVIDISVGVGHLDQAELCIPILKGLGYIYVPEFEAELPERRFLWKGTRKVHTFHVQLTEPTSPSWTRPIMFRNYLRDHPPEAQRYQRLKRELAIQCGSDVDAYVHGKTAFVESILLKAQNLASR